MSDKDLSLERSEKQEALSEEELREDFERIRVDIKCGDFWKAKRDDRIAWMVNEIDRLREELKERDREIIDNGTIAYWRVTRDFAIKENAELKKLLGECEPWIRHYKSSLDAEHSRSYVDQMENVVTRIRAAIGEKSK